MSSLKQIFEHGRFSFVLFLFALMIGTLIWKIVDLHVFDHDFLQGQGDAREDAPAEP